MSPTGSPRVATRPVRAGLVESAWRRGRQDLPDAL